MNKDDNRPEGGPETSDLEAMRDALRLYGHDIRAAVSDIIGGLRLMDMDRLPPDAQIQIERVRVAGETLAELVDGAMMLTSGQDAQAAAASFDFRSFLAGIELRWSGRAREQGLTFRVEIDRHVAERVALARIKLDRILGNLIANALKFADGGQVLLSVWQQDGDLLFRVRDQGRGFSETALKSLFVAGGRPDGQHHPGSGLGLHISKGLADGLGGSLRVSNLPEGGADAILTLPRTTWECREQRAEMPDLSDLRILVAEDNETNQLLVRQMLDAMDASMILARDGQQALDLLAREHVDIALIDIEMPKLSGIEVMQRLRATPGFDTPLVALTAYVMRENREAIYAAGADGVIAKPIRSISAFGQAIRRHVDRSGPIRDPVRQPVKAQNDSLDRNRFESILQAAGPSGREELLDHLLQDLRSVQEALQQAVLENDAATTRAQSHILISLTGAIGADRLQNMAEALNAAAHKNRLTETRALVQSCDDALEALIGQVDRRARREDML